MCGFISKLLNRLLNELFKGDVFIIRYSLIEIVYFNISFMILE